MVQVPPVRVQAVGGEPELYHHGLNGPCRMLHQSLDRDSSWDLKERVGYMIASFVESDILPSKAKDAHV